MSLAGKYSLDKAENYLEWLGAIGVPHDVAIGMYQFRPVIDITHTGDDVEMSSYIGNGYSNNIIKFTVGKDCNWNNHGKTENVYMVKFVKDGKNRYRGSYNYNGHRGETEFEVLPNSLVQTYTQGNIKARKEYKRI